MRIMGNSFPQLKKNLFDPEIKKQDFEIKVSLSYL